jgi:small subunit ribosomal protein S13
MGLDKFFLKLKQNSSGIISVCCSVYGLNHFRLNKIFCNLGFGKLKNENNLTTKQLMLLFKYCEYFFHKEKNKIFNNVEIKKKSKSYCGMRHILKLPARGQRTHTNSSTARTNIKREV